MRILSRDFTIWEKIVLLILVLALMGISYYEFIDQPVRQGIEEAHKQRDALKIDLDHINVLISDYRDHEDELKREKELRKPMPSYNCSAEELNILNDILSMYPYSFTFDKITLERNQIRRGFTFSFTVPTFDAAAQIFTRLSDSPIRCLIGRIECSGINIEEDNVINVKADGAFYETRVDALVDAVLEELIAAQEQAAAQAAAEAAA